MKTIALVGCGHIHTPNFVKMMAARDDIRVAAVWDHNAERAAAHAATLGAAPAATPDEIWRNAAVDAVVICSETNRHAELVSAAVAAGKSVYVEKPLGYSAADALKMADEIEKAGVIFQTGYFMRGNPVFRFVKEQIAAGAFGKITRFRHINCHAGSLKGWFDTEWRWMAEPAIAGCGAFGDLGTHSLDIMMWMLGVPTRVTATIHTVTGRYGDCDETGEALLEFPDGVIGSLAAGWVDVQQPVNMVVSGTEGHAYLCNGQLFFKSDHVEGADGVTPWTQLPPTLPHAFQLFLDAVTGADVPLVSPREAALRSAVMEAMYAANESKRWETPRTK